MRRLKQLGIVLLVAMNVWYLMGQTETFPRYRLVGGTGGIPVETSPTNYMLMTATGTAAAADTGLASTLPRFRLAGGVTGNLAEVDSTGHLLVSGVQGIDTTSTPQFAALGVGMAPVGATGLNITSALANCLSVGPNGITTPIFSVNCSIASAANGLLITPTASGSGVTLATTGGTNEALTVTAKGTGVASLNTGSANSAVKLTVAGNAKLTVGNTSITNAVSTIFTPPGTQTIAGGDTITADACGGIKNITAASGVTTNTTDTFTAPAAANLGCVMHVCNVGAQTITLDHNAHFFSVGGADLALAANTCVAVGQGANTEWRQLTAVLTGT